MVLLLNLLNTYILTSFWVGNVMKRCALCSGEVCDHMVLSGAMLIVATRRLSCTYSYGHEADIVCEDVCSPITNQTTASEV